MTMRHGDTEGTEQILPNFFAPLRFFSVASVSLG